MYLENFVVLTNSFMKKIIKLFFFLYDKSLSVSIYPSLSIYYSQKKVGIEPFWILGFQWLPKGKVGGPTERLPNFYSKD